MTLQLAGIVASYVLIGVLLLSLNLASRWHWGMKAAAIVITSGFFGVSYLSIGELIGWPAEARMPEHFQLHWARVVEARDLEMPKGEPDKDRRLAGAPPRQGEQGGTGDPTAFIQDMPSIEFEDMPPPALPPKQPL